MTSAGEKARDVGPDGEKILDLEYYDLLGVQGTATELEIKKAYRKLALQWHPDRRPGDVEAAEKFKAIGIAYQTLSDPNSRAAYNKYGKQLHGSAAGDHVMDPEALFSSMFGGQNFHSWVGEIALAKEMARAAEIAGEEEKTDAQPGAASASITTPPKQPAAAMYGSSDAHGTGVSTAGVSQGVQDMHVSTNSSRDTPSAAGDTNADHTHKHLASHKKLTPEQKKQLDALDEERQRDKEERIKMLVKQLLERIRPFVQATRPGEKGDSETEAFEKRIRREADDLRLESFGVEMCRLIGSIYVTKASTFLKLHKKGPWSNVLGIPGFFSRMKERGSTIKEGWSFLTSTLDVQTAMEEAAKRQEKGEIPEEEASELDKDLMGKILLVSWRGTRFEVASVLRAVCDIVLSRHDSETGQIDRAVTETVLTNRAKAILLIGAIMQSVEADETDEERRELERLVASAAAKKGKRNRARKDETLGR